MYVEAPASATESTQNVTDLEHATTNGEEQGVEGEEQGESTSSPAESLKIYVLMCSSHLPIDGQPSSRSEDDPDHGMSFHWQA